MNTGFGSWLLGISLGASALGGMLGVASSIVLAATTFGSALLYAQNWRAPPNYDDGRTKIESTCWRAASA